MNIFQQQQQRQQQQATDKNRNHNPSFSSSFSSSLHPGRSHPPIPAFPPYHNKNTPPKRSRKRATLVIVIVLLLGALIVVLADRDLDALTSKALAQLRAVADARELLGRVHLEDVAEDGREDGRLADIDGPAVAGLAGGADVDEREAQPFWERVNTLFRMGKSRGDKLTGSCLLCGRSGPEG